MGQARPRVRVRNPRGFIHWETCDFLASEEFGSHGVIPVAEREKLKCSSQARIPGFLWRTCHISRSSHTEILPHQVPLMRHTYQASLAMLLVGFGTAIADEPITLNVWPGQPPGESKELPPEIDKTKPSDKLIAGRRIIKLGNVSTPQLMVYQPPANKATGTAVVVCPGGGHHILAMDLEGTEVAEWLNSTGVTAIVLKYRVPARDPNPKRWRAAVQDAQRTVSIVRSKAKEWKIRPERIGIMGFSAGGETAALASIFEKRTYEPVDAADNVSMRPDFAMLIYPGFLVPRDGGTKLHDYIKVTKNTPPMFFVHAFDDRVTPQSSLILASELKKHGVPAELHIYAKGGHGYGLRKTDEPVTTWPKRAEEWFARMKLLR